jgi:hypothetical protein
MFYKKIKHINILLLISQIVLFHKIFKPTSKPLHLNLYFFTQMHLIKWLVKF